MHACHSRVTCGSPDPRRRADHPVGHLEPGGRGWRPGPPSRRARRRPAPDDLGDVVVVLVAGGLVEARQSRGLSSRARATAVRCCSPSEVSRPARSRKAARSSASANGRARSSGRPLPGRAGRQHVVLDAEPGQQAVLLGYDGHDRPVRPAGRGPSVDGRHAALRVPRGQPRGGTRWSCPTPTAPRGAPARPARPPGSRRGGTSTRPAPAPYPWPIPEHGPAGGVPAHVPARPSPAGAAGHWSPSGSTTTRRSGNRSNTSGGSWSRLVASMTAAAVRRPAVSLDRRPGVVAQAQRPVARWVTVVVAADHHGRRPRPRGGRPATASALAWSAPRSACRPRPAPARRPGHRDGEPLLLLPSRASGRCRARSARLTAAGACVGSPAPARGDLAELVDCPAGAGTPRWTPVAHEPDQPPQPARRWRPSHVAPERDRRPALGRSRALQEGGRLLFAAARWPRHDREHPVGQLQADPARSVWFSPSPTGRP